LMIMLVFMPLAQMIPMTALSAILIMVAYNMSEWRAFKGLFKSTKSDITVLMATFLLTVLFDLVVAIEISMVIAMFLFVKRMSESTDIANTSLQYKAFYEEDDNDESDFEETNNLHEYLGSKILLYEINGPLFFGAATAFVDVMSEINSKAYVLILRMKNVPSIDATAFSSLKAIEKGCREKHITILFAEVTEQPMKLLINTGFKAKIGDDRFYDSTADAIAAANVIVNSKTAVHAAGKLV